jgi:hypothetical protein
MTDVQETEQQLTGNVEQVPEEGKKRSQDKKRL